MKCVESKNSEDNSIEKLADDVAEEIRQHVLNLISAIRRGGSGNNGIITIDELERNWDILDTETKKTFARVIGDELSSINEKPLIEAKKESSQKGG